MVFGKGKHLPSVGNLLIGSDDCSRLWILDFADNVLACKQMVVSEESIGLEQNSKKIVLLSFVICYSLISEAVL